MNFLLATFGWFFYGKSMDDEEKTKPIKESPLWEPLHDDDGIPVAGCFHTIPAPDSDNL